MKNTRKAINAGTNKTVTIPYYIIFSCGMPTVCNDYSMAIDKAREITRQSYNRDEEAKIFDTLLGEFVGTYKNGKLVK